MKKLSVSELREFISQYTRNQKLEMMENTSTVSWLYPGQFAYCLNEEFVWSRYGTFIDCPEEIHFHKIQPAIRWNDYCEFYLEGTESPRTHLGLFDMTTINGGHIILFPKKNIGTMQELFFMT